MGLVFLLIFTIFLYGSLSTHKTRAIAVILTCGLYYLLRNDLVIFINIMTVVCIPIGIIQSYVKYSLKPAVLTVLFTTIMAVMKTHFFPVGDTQSPSVKTQLESSENVKNSAIQTIIAGNNSKASKTQDKSQPVKGNQ